MFWQYWQQLGEYTHEIWNSTTLTWHTLFFSNLDQQPWRIHSSNLVWIPKTRTPRRKAFVEKWPITNSAMENHNFLFRSPENFSRMPRLFSLIPWTQWLCIKVEFGREKTICKRSNLWKDSRLLVLSTKKRFFARGFTFWSLILLSFYIIIYHHITYDHQVIVDWKVQFASYIIIYPVYMYICIYHSIWPSGKLRKNDGNFAFFSSVFWSSNSTHGFNKGGSADGWAIGVSCDPVIFFGGNTPWRFRKNEEMTNSMGKS